MRKECGKAHRRRAQGLRCKIEGSVQKEVPAGNESMARPCPYSCSSDTTVVPEVMMNANGEIAMTREYHPSHQSSWMSYLSLMNEPWALFHRSGWQRNPVNLWVSKNRAQEWGKRRTVGTKEVEKAG
jgi:hypothetical protein